MLKVTFQHMWAWNHWIILETSGPFFPAVFFDHNQVWFGVKATERETAVWEIIWTFYVKPLDTFDKMAFNWEYCAEILHIEINILQVENINNRISYQIQRVTQRTLKSKTKNTLRALITHRTNTINQTAAISLWDHKKTPPSDFCSSTPFLEGPVSRRANPDRKQKPPLFTSCTQ